VPTFEVEERFWRGYAQLSREERAAFQRMRRRFVADLRAGRLRVGLRVRALEGHEGIYEITWAPDGRATFHYGEARRPGEAHIVWRRVGGHEIFDNP
jgi:hypothetical protein